MVLLTGCAGFWPAVNEIAKDPQVQDGVIDIVENAASGNWVGAVFGVGSVISLIAGKKVWQRVKVDGHDDQVIEALKEMDGS